MPFNDGAYLRLIDLAGGPEGLASKLETKLTSLGVTKETIVQWTTTCGDGMTTRQYDALHCVADELGHPELNLYDRQQKAP